eukprot:1070782-Rhodomonas_salina.1
MKQDRNRDSISSNTREVLCKYPGTLVSCRAKALFFFPWVDLPEFPGTHVSGYPCTRMPGYPGTL